MHNVDLFYKAYHELCKRVNDEKYKSIFRLEAGHILLVSSHRVLHGRKEFTPDGKRHLQDAYFELDNIENNLCFIKFSGYVSDEKVSFTSMDQGTKDDYDLVAIHDSQNEEAYQKGY